MQQKALFGFKCKISAFSIISEKVKGPKKRDRERDYQAFKAFLSFDVSSITCHIRVYVAFCLIII
jgi:hypothetical protein